MQLGRFVLDEVGLHQFVNEVMDFCNILSCVHELEEPLHEHFEVHIDRESEVFLCNLGLQGLVFPSTLSDLVGRLVPCLLKRFLNVALNVSKVDDVARNLNLDIRLCIDLVHNVAVLARLNVEYCSFLALFKGVFVNVVDGLGDFLKSHLVFADELDVRLQFILVN